MKQKRWGAGFGRQSAAGFANPFEVALERGRGVHVGLLVGHAPIAQLLDADRLARHDAAYMGAVLQHLEFPVEVTDFGLLAECEGTLDAIYTVFRALQQTTLAAIVFVQWFGPMRVWRALALRGAGFLGFLTKLC